MAQLAIPAALALIMLGMGLGLTPDDFVRVVRFPRAVLGGLLGQMILLPLLAFVLVTVLQLDPMISIGVMLIALTPGGAVSNLFCLLARGDVALSVTLTAVTSMLTVFTLPVFLTLFLEHFVTTGQLIELPLLQTILQIALITVIPVSIGMALRYRYPKRINRAQKLVKYIAGGFVLMAVVMIMLREKQAFFDKFMLVCLVTIGLNLLTMVMGFCLGLLLKLDRRGVITLAIEIGIQNAILATAIAASPLLLNSTALAVVPTIYGFTMMLVTPILIFILNRFMPEKDDHDSALKPVTG